ncbi:MAG: hypothetical protein ACJ788_03200 [Ktedonobacteraceae bacterium]
MPRKRTYTSYTVIIMRYADEAMRERFEQGSQQAVDYTGLVSEFVYLGSSEARARAAYFQASRRAQKDALVMNITVWCNDKVLIRVTPE